MRLPGIDPDTTLRFSNEPRGELVSNPGRWTSRDGLASLGAGDLLESRDPRPSAAATWEGEGGDENDMSGGADEGTASAPDFLESDADPSMTCLSVRVAVLPFPIPLPLGVPLTPLSAAPNTLTAVAAENDDVLEGVNDFGGWAKAIVRLCAAGVDEVGADDLRIGEEGEEGGEPCVPLFPLTAVPFPCTGDSFGVVTALLEDGITVDRGVVGKTEIVGEGVFGGRKRGRKDEDCLLRCTRKGDLGVVGDD